MVVVANRFDFGGSESWRMLVSASSSDELAPGPLTDANPTPSLEMALTLESSLNTESVCVASCSLPSGLEMDELLEKRTAKASGQRQEGARVVEVVIMGEKKEEKSRRGVASVGKIGPMSDRDLASHGPEASLPLNLIHSITSAT